MSYNLYYIKLVIHRKVFLMFRTIYCTKMFIKNVLYGEFYMKSHWI